MEDRNLYVGDPVVYVDEHGRKSNALVLAVWGNQKSVAGNYPCINLVHVSINPDKTDPNGRQTEKDTSVVHKDVTSAPGFYWMFPDEEATPYGVPNQK
jgi:hypothetical protein